LIGCQLWTVDVRWCVSSVDCDMKVG